MNFENFLENYPYRNRNFKNEILYAKSKFDETYLYHELLEIFKMKRNENNAAFESYATMLNELKSALELNKIKDAKIERLTNENISLKNDLITYYTITKI